MSMSSSQPERHPLLPFLSYGGSFTMVNFISVGLILGVDIRRYVNR